MLPRKPAWEALGKHPTSTEPLPASSGGHSSGPTSPPLKNRPRAAGKCIQLTSALAGANPEHPKRKTPARGPGEVEAFPVEHSKQEGCSMPMLNSRVRLQRALARDHVRRRPPITVASTVGNPTAATPAVPAPAPNGPLRLTDDQLAAVMRAAEPLAAGDRGAFLQDVAAALQGRDLADGTVYRVITEAQRRHFDPPIIGFEPHRR